MDYKAEKITPYGNGDSKTEQVRDMFDAIAPAYDFMNRAMTFGIDRIWRRIAVGMIRKYRPSSVLDVATGTGDLAQAARATLETASTKRSFSQIIFMMGSSSLKLKKRTILSLSLGNQGREGICKNALSFSSIDIYILVTLSKIL